MQQPIQEQSKPNIEFIALMASLMAIVALSIDALLPALPDIAEDLNVTDPTKNQLLITMIFLGLGFGQLIFGPLSDSFGRKPIIYTGFSLFVIASILCVTTNSFEVLVFGRILQGIGLSAPRTISIAMVRDTYSGDRMAQVMSFVVMIFILVPVVAPTMGQFLITFYDWHSIFNLNLIYGLLVLFWFWKRQPETHPKQNHTKLSLNLFVKGTKEFFKYKEAVVYTIVSGLITGSFMVYLSTSQQIFENQYHLADLFPYIFASLAIAIGFSTFLNSTLVIRFGMKRIAFMAAIAYSIVSILYVFLFWSGVNPPLSILWTFFGFQFISIGFLFGNLRSLAMHPIGHIAGIGAAINGFASTIMAVPIANYVGSFVTDSVLPLFIGFSLCGLVSVLLFLTINGKNYS
ncbi:multidrug effflux MFS transporter [Mangrovimonas xylaniphaga]|uniref:multidrug effflux MFS transporter n=1 Tax=Mangrovimonas xylaniphaga TaxID=1645915 RepID=UPI0006B50D9E|nr:multidrug effflux MFS transporter [Mangrovimonas xylaniphaga]